MAFWPWAALGGWFASLAVAITWPLVLRFTESLYANEGTADIAIFLWNLWWVKEAVLHAANPLWTPMLYYPQGISLAYHTLSLPQGLLALPWTLSGNYLVAYNLVVLLSLASSGFAMALLAKGITHSWLAATFAGTYFILAPNYIVHVASAHLNLISWQWVLLASWALLKLGGGRRRYRWAMPAAFGLFAALAVYSDLLYGVFLALLVPTLYLTRYGLVVPSRPLVIETSVGLSVALLLILPLSAGLVAGYSDVNASASWVTAEERLSSNAPDMAYYVLPKGGTDEGLAFYSSLLPRVATIPPKGSENRAFLGFLPTALALVGLYRHRGLWPVALLAAVCAVLSLGPQIKLLGSSVGANPLFNLLHSLPFMAFSRTPGRFLFMVSLSVAILAASALTSRTGHPATAGPDLNQLSRGRLWHS